MSKLSGGCLCGAVRYSVAAESPLPVVCHCTHCQKQSGSAFSYALVVPTSALSVSGALKTYRDVGSSGMEVLRKFCPECGSAILSEMAALPGMTAIKAGTLDEDYGLAPVFHAWCDSALPWVNLPDGVPHFPQQPPTA